MMSNSSPNEEEYMKQANLYSLSAKLKKYGIKVAGRRKTRKQKKRRR